MATLTLEIPDDIYRGLREVARKNGGSEADVLRDIAKEALPQYLQSEQSEVVQDARYLSSLPPAERDRLMRQQAEEMAPYYERDLALPPAERELTAFSAINDPILEPDEYLPAEEPRS